MGRATRSRQQAAAGRCVLQISPMNSAARGRGIAVARLPRQPHKESVHMVSRRDFVRICTMAGAAVGMSATTVSQIVEAAAKGLKPSVVWLHFQECTGCTESLLRTSHPGIDEVILDLISLDYHE